MNVVQKDEADEDGSDDEDDHEPPAKKAAVTSAEEDFDLPFGHIKINLLMKKLLLEMKITLKGSTRGILRKLK